MQAIQIGNVQFFQAEVSNLLKIFETGKGCQIGDIIQLKGIDLGDSFQAPEINFARTVQGLVSGNLTGVEAEMKALKDRYNAALDAAFAAAKADGANVDRSDLVFANWNPDVDFGASDY